jgi:hypothetical protein
MSAKYALVRLVETESAINLEMIRQSLRTSHGSAMICQMTLRISFGLEGCIRLSSPDFLCIAKAHWSRGNRKSRGKRKRKGKRKLPI